MRQLIIIGRGREPIFTCTRDNSLEGDTLTYLYGGSTAFHTIVTAKQQFYWGLLFPLYTQHRIFNIRPECASCAYTHIVNRHATEVMQITTHAAVRTRLRNCMGYDAKPSCLAALAAFVAAARVWHNSRWWRHPQHSWMVTVSEKFQPVVKLPTDSLSRRRPIMPLPLCYAIFNWNWKYSIMSFLVRQVCNKHPTKLRRLESSNVKNLELKATSIQFSTHRKCSYPYPYKRCADVE